MATSPEGLQPIADGLARFYASSELSDFVINCGGQSWPVHRLILTLHSKVLAKSCNGDFLETSQGFVDLEEDSPACVNAMVQFLYPFNYDPDIGTYAPAFHVQVAVLADKYNIAALKNSAFSKCKAALENFLDKPDALADAISTAYESAAAVPEICQYLVDIALDHPAHGIDVTTAIHSRLKRARATPAPRTTGETFHKCPTCNYGRLSKSHQSPDDYNCINCGHYLNGSWTKYKVFKA